MMRAYSAKTNCLSFFLDIFHEHIFTESSVVGVIVSDFNAMLSTVCFPGNLCFESFSAVGGALQVDKSQARMVIHEDGGKFVPGRGKSAFELAHKTWSGAFHLVDRYHLSLCVRFSQMFF